MQAPQAVTAELLTHSAAAAVAPNPTVQNPDLKTNGNLSKTGNDSKISEKSQSVIATGAAGLTATTPVGSAAAASATEINPAPATAAVTFDTKEALDIPRKQIPLPKNEQREWTISSGDLDTLDAHKLNQDAIVYKCNLIGNFNSAQDATAAPSSATIASVGSAAAAAAADASVDQKIILEKLRISHIAISYANTMSNNHFQRQYEKSKKSSIVFTLVFDNANPASITALNRSIYNIKAISVLIPDAELSPQCFPSHFLPNGQSQFLCYVIGMHREKVVKNIFDRLIKHGVFSLQEANYFMKICGYQPITLAEQRKMEQIDSAIQKRDYDAVVPLVKAIHDEAIKESEELGIMWGGNKDSKKIFYFDPASAAFDIGIRLFTLSPLHAIQIFDVLGEGSPYFEQKTSLATIFAPSLKDNFRFQSKKARKEIIRFLMGSLAYSNGENEALSTLNLVFDCLENNAGYDLNVSTKRIFKKLTSINTLFDTLLDNIIEAANRLYYFRQESSKQSAIIQSGEDLAVAATIVPIATTQSVSAASIPANASASATPIVTTLASGLDFNSDGYSDLLVGPYSGMSTPTSTAITIDTKKAKDESATIMLTPLENLEIATGDIHKFLKDNTEQEFIVLKTKKLSDIQPEQQNVAASDPKTAAVTATAAATADSKEKQDMKPSLVFNKIIFARLKETCFDETLSQRKETPETFFNLILLADDPSAQINRLSSIPQDMVQAMKRNSAISKLDCYESTNDFIHQSSKFSLYPAGQHCGRRVLAFRIGAMRANLLDILFDTLVQNKMIAEQAASDIKTWAITLCQVPSAQESKLLQAIHEKMLEVDKLQGLINLEQSKTKADEKNKKEATQNANDPKLTMEAVQSGLEEKTTKETDLIQKRNALIHSALEDARVIHLLIRNDSKAKRKTLQNQGNDYPLDNSDVAFNLGKSLMLLSPQAAYAAFEILTRGNLFYPEAMEYMAPIAIDLAMNASTEAERRPYREKSIRHMMDNQDEGINFREFMRFIKTHAGYDSFSAADNLFSDIKNENNDLGNFSQMLCGMSDKLAEFNPHHSKTATQNKTASSGGSHGNNAGDSKEFNDTAAGTTPLTFAFPNLSLAGANQAKAQPSNAALSAAASAAAGSNKAAKGLDEDSDDETLATTKKPSKKA